MKKLLFILAVILCSCGISEFDDTRKSMNDSYQEINRFYDSLNLVLDSLNKEFKMRAEEVRMNKALMEQNAKNLNQLFGELKIYNNRFVNLSPDTLHFGEGFPNPYYGTKGDEIIIFEDGKK